MNLLELLIALEEAGVADVLADKDDIVLCYKGTIPDELYKEVERHKETLMKRLKKWRPVKVSK